MLPPVEPLTRVVVVCWSLKIAVRPACLPSSCRRHYLYGLSAGRPDDRDAPDSVSKGDRRRRPQTLLSGRRLHRFSLSTANRSLPIEPILATFRPHPHLRSLGRDASRSPSAQQPTPGSLERVSSHLPRSATITAASKTVALNMRSRRADRLPCAPAAFEGGRSLAIRRPCWRYTAVQQRDHVTRLQSPGSDCALEDALGPGALVAE